MDLPGEIKQPVPIWDGQPGTRGTTQFRSVDHDLTSPGIPFLDTVRPLTVTVPAQATGVHALVHPAARRSIPRTRMCGIAATPLSVTPLDRVLVLVAAFYV